MDAKISLISACPRADIMRVHADPSPGLQGSRNKPREGAGFVFYGLSRGDCSPTIFELQHWIAHRFVYSYAKRQIKPLTRLPTLGSLDYSFRGLYRGSKPPQKILPVLHAHANPHQPLLDPIFRSPLHFRVVSYHRVRTCDREIGP